jgi:hypothetical protein
MFEAYGPVDEVILHESYGFIQFHTPEAAANAIARESGRTIGGRRIGWYRVVENRPHSSKLFAFGPSCAMKLFGLSPWQYGPWPYSRARMCVAAPYSD